MKKIYLLAILAMLSLVAQAQIVSSRSSRTTIHREEKVRVDRDPSIFMDLGLGLTTGDRDNTLGFDLGFRWNKMFTENFGWDIIKISAQSDIDDFTGNLSIQAKTGIRGVTPVLFGNSTLFANVAAGYGYFTDLEKGGFAWEGGVGINFNRRTALSIVYNSNSVKFDGYYGSYTLKAGLLSLRLSYGF